MDHAALIASLITARQSWVELPNGAQVRILRPDEAEFGKFVHGVTVDHVCEYVDNWRDVTEATLLGGAVGADDAVTFNAGLWRAWVRDNVSAVEVVAKAIGAAISAHIQAREKIAGN
jgi:hypothetical protein